MGNQIFESRKMKIMKSSVKIRNKNGLKMKKKK